MRRYFLFVFVAVAVICMLFLGGRKMLAQSSLAPQLITQAVDEHNLVTLSGNVHPLARADYDRGIAPSTLSMNHMMLVLKRSPGQQAALDELIAQHADRTSPNYHAALTSAQFGQEFGASDQDLNTITLWLSSHGFQVAPVASGRDIIDFSGDAGEVRDAFHTEIHHFVVNGEDHYANASEPQIPAALAPIVSGIYPLNDFHPRAMHRTVGQFKMDIPSRKIVAAGAAAHPEFTFASTSCGTGSSCYAVAPYDFATIYNLLPLWNAGITGAGEKIAIISDSNINYNTASPSTSDVGQFRSITGLSGFPGTVNQVYALQSNGQGVNPGLQDCAVNGDEQEAITDVEWAGAAAPAAEIDLVMAPSAPTASCPNTPSNSGETLPNNYVSGFGGDYAAYWEIEVNPTPDPILSDSYGSCELMLGASGNSFYNTLWGNADAKNIAVIVATGDAGSAACDSSGTSPAQFGLAVNGSASTPHNIAVGGTDFDYPSSNPAPYWSSTNAPTPGAGTLSVLTTKAIPETVYNDTCTNPELFSFLGATTAVNACNSSNDIGSGYDLLVPVGGGGGASSCISPTGNGPQSCAPAGGYQKPPFQLNSGLTANDSSRDVPDVALFAGDGNVSGSFYIICEDDQNQGDASCETTPSLLFTGEGGTSVATQAFAGIVALIEQKNGVTLGSTALNTNLYALGKAESFASCNASAASGLSYTTSCVFRDISTPGTNAVPCQVNTFECPAVAAVPAYPKVRPDSSVRRSPFLFEVSACGLLSAILLFLATGNRRAWRTAFALLLFGVLLASVSCGGGGGIGTITTGGSDTVNVLSGFSAGAGYDQATGLGSVNANALASAGGW